MNTLPDVLSRLERVRRDGAGWRASCPLPGHGKGRGDRNPSLSLRETADGRVVAFCHAGCGQRELVATLGINGDGHAEPEAIYRYLDADGRPIFEVVRFPGKQFRQHTPDGRWGLNGTRPVLFRLPQVVRAVRDGVPVWICEGERDVESLEKHGRIATCNRWGPGSGVTSTRRCCAAPTW
jgi:putative DNA primase/helicase